MTRLYTYFILLALVLPFRALSQSDAITIGLLLPDGSQKELITAAELAIDRANAEGPYQKRPFSLEVRTAEGFWGAGSKESVNLVYEDQVRAIIGSLDGRNGHLAEQVATKSHLSYIEAFATEVTLSQAFVPWFMRVVPNDNQQAASILAQIKKEGGGPVCILSRENYDTRYAVKSLTKAVARETGVSPLVLDLDDKNILKDKLVQKILDSKSRHLIIPFNAQYLKELIESLGREKPELKIYGTLHFSMGLESRKESWDSYEGIYLILPELSKKYPSLPDSRSAYIYDAVNLVINAIRQVGTDRETITDYISTSMFSKGATGKIFFDELGNRQEAASLFYVQNGLPLLIDTLNQ